MCNTSPFIVQAYKCSDAVSDPPVFSSKFVTVPSLPMGPPPPLPCEYAFNSYSVLVPSQLPETLRNNPFIPIPNEILGTLPMTKTVRKKAFKSCQTELDERMDVAHGKGFNSESMSTILVKHVSEYPPLPDYNIHAKEENFNPFVLTDTLNLLRFSKYFYKSFCHTSKHVTLRRSESAPNLLKKNSLIVSLFPKSKSWELTVMESKKTPVPNQTKNIPSNTDAFIQYPQHASHTWSLPEKTDVFQQNSNAKSSASCPKIVKSHDVSLTKKKCCENDKRPQHLRTTRLLKKMSKPLISSKIIFNGLHENKQNLKAGHAPDPSIYSIRQTGLYNKFSRTVKNIIDKKKNNLIEYSVAPSKQCQSRVQTVRSKKMMVENASKSEISSTRASEQKSIHRFPKTFVNFSRVVPRYKHFNKVDISSDYRSIKKNAV